LFCVTYKIYTRHSNCTQLLGTNNLCMKWSEIAAWDICRPSYNDYYDVTINYVSGPYATSLECQGECD
jgi:hypothetical protein